MTYVFRRLDLFTDTAFDEQELARYLNTAYDLELDFIAKHTIKGEISGVQVDCIAHRYPWLAPPLLENGIRFAGFEDIAAMKLNAITGNGTRLKDVIDVAYMSERLSLNEMLHAYGRKYMANTLIPVKAITYFNDINFYEPICMTENVKFDWKKIANRLQKMQKYPDKLFPRIA